MIYFIFGGSASGKSEYAEDLAVSCAAARLSGAGEAAVYEEASGEIQDVKALILSLPERTKESAEVRRSGRRRPAVGRCCTWRRCAGTAEKRRPA